MVHWNVVAANPDWSVLLSTDIGGKDLRFNWAELRMPAARDDDFAPRTTARTWAMTVPPNPALPAAGKRTGGVLTFGELVEVCAGRRKWQVSCAGMQVAAPGRVHYEARALSACRVDGIRVAASNRSARAEHS